MRSFKGVLALVLSLVGVGAFAAVGPDGEPLFARNSFATMDDLKLPPNATITKIRSDGANNMYLTTEGGGIMAVSLKGNNLERISTDFPINKTRYPSDFLLSDFVSSIAFAPFDSKEHFFFTSDDLNGSAGLQWARYSDRVQFEDRVELLSNINSDIAKDVVIYDIVYNEDTNSLYAASEEGLLELEIVSELGPQITAKSPYELAPTNPDFNVVSRVIDATAFNGGAPAIAFFTREFSSEPDTGKYLYLFEPGIANPISQIDRPFSLATIGAIKEIESDIYVVQKGPDTGSSTPDTVRRILKYTFDGTGYTDTLVAEFNPDLGNPSDPTDFPSDSNFLVTDFAVDPVDGTIWLATTGRAFYQVPDISGNFDPRVCEAGADWEDPSDDFYEGDGTLCAATGAGWRPVMKLSNEIEGVSNNSPHQYRSVFLDEGGNVWLGSNLGLRGLISRYMSLNSTRYVGLNRIATVSLDDVNPGTNPYFFVTVGSVSADFPATFDSEGKATLAFGFTLDETVDPDADPTPDPILFPVASTPEGVPITVEYFADEGDAEPTLTASASWAQIIPFEDDFFIGGPCMVEALFCGE